MPAEGHGVRPPGPQRTAWVAAPCGHRAGIPTLPTGERGLHLLSGVDLEVGSEAGCSEEGRGDARGRRWGLVGAWLSTPPRGWWVSVGTS